MHTTPNEKFKDHFEDNIEDYDDEDDDIVQKYSRLTVETLS